MPSPIHVSPTLNIYTTDPSPVMVSEDLITIGGAAQRLNLSATRIHQLVKQDVIRKYDLGKGISLLSMPDVVRYDIVRKPSGRKSAGAMYIDDYTYNRLAALILQIAPDANLAAVEFVETRDTMADFSEDFEGLAEVSESPFKTPRGKVALAIIDKGDWRAVASYDLQ